jgi:hypothetical protein
MKSCRTCLGICPKCGDTTDEEIPKLDSLQLVCNVPNIDFDGGDLTLALRWVRQQRQLNQLPPNIDWEDKGRHAERILQLLADKYNEALGEVMIK